MAAKTPKTQKVKPSRPTAKTSEVKQAQTIAGLRQRLDARNRDLAESLQRERATASENVRLSNALNEALEQQKSTSEILRVIASSEQIYSPCSILLLKALRDSVIPLTPKCIASRATCSGR
jgi:hypothetical protein